MGPFPHTRGELVGVGYTHTHQRDLRGRPRVILILVLRTIVT